MNRAVTITFTRESHSWPRLKMVDQSSGKTMLNIEIAGLVGRVPETREFRSNLLIPPVTETEEENRQRLARNAGQEAGMEIAALVESFFSEVQIKSPPSDRVKLENASLKAKVDGRYGFSQEVTF